MMLKSVQRSKRVKPLHVDIGETCFHAISQRKPTAVWRGVSPSIFQKVLFRNFVTCRDGVKCPIFSDTEGTVLSSSENAPFGRKRVGLSGTTVGFYSQFRAYKRLHDQSSFSQKCTAPPSTHCAFGSCAKLRAAYAAPHSSRHFGCVNQGAKPAGSILFAL